MAQCIRNLKHSKVYQMFYDACNVRLDIHFFPALKICRAYLHFPVGPHGAVYMHQASRRDQYRLRTGIGGGEGGPL
jgi:hypothetical protein